MEFGKLEKVDLRKLWNGEASDFTPWLAKDDNITELGNQLGIELEVQDQEAAVGPFRADILCKDTLTDNYVLIENQLERTDHTHLGQLMTYAAGLDAVSIIWIAKVFSEEHRAALDWLNNITDESINFFGIEIEAFRIGKSLPAPMFKVVAKPNDWTKSMRTSSGSGKITETKQLQLEYWQAMKKYFEASGTTLKFQKPQPQHWTNFAIGRSHFHISAICGVMNELIRIDLTFSGPSAKDNYFQFKNKYQVEADNQFNNRLVWNDLPDAKVSIISFEKSAETSNRSLWSEQHEWFRENIEMFNDFFRPKIKAL